MLSVQLLKCVLSGLVVGGMLTLMSSSEAASPLVGTMQRIDGSSQDLSAYQGKVVLIVNVASQCGYTSQYAGLQKLYETYKDKGLVILGFPANDFGAQEPGSDGEIAAFCATTYGVTFDMFAKTSVKGAKKTPLYQALTESAEPSGEVGWNFEKFLLGRDGQIIGRYKSSVGPEDSKLVAAIEAAL